LRQLAQKFVQTGCKRPIAQRHLRSCATTAADGVDSSSGTAVPRLELSLAKLTKAGYKDLSTK